MLRGVQVSIGNISAVNATMHPICQRFRNQRQFLATTTQLSRMVRRNCDHGDTSFFRFVRQDRQERFPRDIKSGFCKPTTGDTPNMHSFVNNRTVARNQSTRRLVVAWRRKTFLVQCDNEVNVIRHHLQSFNRHAQRISLFVQEGFEPVGTLPVHHLAPVLRAPDNVIVQRSDTARMPDVTFRTYVLNITNHSMPVKYLRETNIPVLPLLPKGGQSPRRGVGVRAIT